jgi:hypothetical protein
MTEALLRHYSLGDRISSNVRYERTPDQRLVEVHVAVDEWLANETPPSGDTRHVAAHARGSTGSDRDD